MIRIPEEFALTVAKWAFGASTWLQRVYSSQIPGFSTLMRSRFTQFFVWRELMNFPKSTEFLFDITSSKNIAVSGKNLNYQVNATLQAQMYAPKNGKYVPFMNFEVPLASQVALALDQGKVLARFSRVALNLQEYWSPAYVERYHPARPFARRAINKRIQTAAEGGSIAYALPRIPLAGNVSLQIQKVQKSATSTDLVFYLT
jgi:hypothetical protein